MSRFALLLLAGLLCLAVQPAAAAPGAVAALTLPATSVWRT